MHLHRYGLSIAILALPAVQCNLRGAHWLLEAWSGIGVP